MPVFARSIAYVLLEHAVEVLRILVSQLIGNLADCLPASYNHFFGQVDDFVLDIFLRRLSGFLLHQISEIVGGEEHFVCEVFHGRQSFGLRFVALEIVVYQCFEFHQDIFVGCRAGDELAFVETHAVVQQQFDVACNQTLAVLVDGALDFHLNLLQTVEEDFFLVFGQMQCLGRGIGKEGILLYSLSQRGAFYQVGVEQQAGGAGLHTFRHVDLSHLARGEAGYRAFLVIVILFSIAYVSAFGVLRKRAYTP